MDYGANEPEAVAGLRRCVQSPIARLHGLGLTGIIRQVPRGYSTALARPAARFRCVARASA